MEFSGSRLKRFLLVISFGLAMTGILLALVSEFHEEITEIWLQDADTAIIKYLHLHVSPLLTRVMFVLSLLGSWKVLFPVVATGMIWLLLIRSRHEALIFVTAIAGAASINVALKLLFQRPRPRPFWALAHESSYSFPSGHAAAAFVFYGVLAFMAVRRSRTRALSVLIALTAAFLILGIGASRVDLGVHYPSDVAAGYLVGVIWLAGVALGSTQLNRSRKTNNVEPDFIDVLVVSVNNSIRHWKQRAKSLKRDVYALYLAKRDPRISWYAKFLGIIIVAYALSPIDLIPDFIPVFGYLDDLVLLPAGILLLLKLIPSGVMEEYRVKASNPELRISKNWFFGALIVVTWLVAIAISARWLYARFTR
jgi:membrane-associated phospholipid phosphatase/uncharacterized membrane protein YkvA (DUF1232 family)